MYLSLDGKFKLRLYYTIIINNELKGILLHLNGIALTHINLITMMFIYNTHEV